MPELTPQAKGWLTDLKTKFEARRRDFGWAELVGGYSTAESEPILAHLAMWLHPAEDERKPFRTEYPHFTLFSQVAKPERAWDLFLAIAVGEPFKLAVDFPDLRFRDCTVDQPSRHWSRSYPFNTDWPIDVGRLNGAQDGRVRHELLASVSGQIFTGPQEAIDEIARTPVGWSGYAPAVYLIMPDRRARIVDPRVSTKSVSGKVERGSVSSTGLILRAYASEVGSSPRRNARLGAIETPSRFEVDEPQGAFSFETGFYSNHLILALIDKGSDSVLDQREYEPGQFSLSNDVATETDATYLDSLIQAGESERVEFKENFEGGDGWLRTICAFANGEGGIILFGIRNDSSVSGLPSVRSADSISQRVRGTVEPFPSYQFGSVEIQGKNVSYVQVASGSERPYTVRDQGVFVRAQATTRQATRHELMLLAKPSEGSPFR